jgi:hypothetical protein
MPRTPNWEHLLDQNKSQLEKVAEDETNTNSMLLLHPQALRRNDYERPRLDVFNQHCDSVIAKYELDRLHRQGFVTAIEPNHDHVGVELRMTTNDSSASATSQHMNDDNTIVYTAENIVLALGNDDPSYAE